MTSSSKKFDLPKLPVIESCYSRYFGLTPGGVDLLAALAALPLDALKTLHDLLCDTTRAGGRVFIMGNGGSFDNSRFIADLFHRQGLICKTPGRPECYLQARTSDEYAAIFRRGLEEDRLCCNDLVIGLSGSGNSPNILEAFKYAQAQDAKIFALGGRTGGAMRKITGDQRALIVSSDNMEAIEDLHSACGVILAKMLERKESCTDVHAKFISALKRCLTPQTIQGMARLAHELLRTMRDESFVFILGTGPGANHFRADAQRGFTNNIPLRGIAAPEMYTINSGMATLNDDGPAFLLADGLAKYSPGERDFALLVQLPGSELQLAPVRELLQAGNVPTLELGVTSTGIDFSSCIEECEGEFVPTLVSHASGAVMRELLSKIFEVRTLSGVKADLGGQRKLDLAATLELEERLRKEGHLGPQEVLTFSYGELHAAKNPTLLGMKRGHY